MVRRRNTIALSGPTSDQAGAGRATRVLGRPARESASNLSDGSALEQVRAVAAQLGIGMLGLGFQPKWRREESLDAQGPLPDHAQLHADKGRLGLDMMLRTCTIQTNLDFSSEADMVKKFRVGLALQPVATALFANSPFTEGQPNGFLSYRSHVWTDTDPDRSGILPFVFEDGMGFERYVEYVLDVPMYFVYRDGKYIDAAGQSFRDFLKGRLPALPGEMPTITDWSDHLTTLFPEVRLKRYLEMRGADGGPWRRCARCRLVGRRAVPSGDPRCGVGPGQGLDIEEHAYLRAEVPRQGLRTPFRGGTVQDLARAMLALADAGLTGRAEEDWFGQDERQFLTALRGIAESGRTPADEKLALFHGRWRDSVDPIFAEFAY